MDNLTHTLVGAALARTRPARGIPLAMTTAVVAANAPDIDVLSFFKGPYFALEFRRGVTHGWPALVILTLLVTGTMVAWDRLVRLRRHPGAAPVRAGPLLLLAGAGVLSHPVLDWLNTYGMRWGLPFHDGWSYGDTLFIIDPWLWLALGAAVFLTGPRGWRSSGLWGALAALATALVLTGPVDPGARVVWCVGLATVIGASLASRPSRRSTGAQPPGPAFPGLPRTALLGMALYIGVSMTLARLAASEIRVHAEGLGLAVQDVLVGPVPGSPLSSEVEVRTEAGYVPGRHSWWTRPRVVLEPEGLVPEESVAGVPGLRPPAAVLDAARQDSDVRSYLVWSRYPVTVATPREDGWIVRIGDARYDGRNGSGSLSGVETFVPVEAGDAGPHGMDPAQGSDATHTASVTTAATATAAATTPTAADHATGANVP